MGSTYQTTVVNAPVDQVWAMLRNFHDFSWASKVIEKCQPVGDKQGDEVGARRILNDAFEETLLELNDADRTVRYSIDDGPSPVSKEEVKNYIGMIRVLPVTDENTTFVEWSSQWEGNEAKAQEFCHGIYIALLKSLKDAFV